MPTLKEYTLSVIIPSRNEIFLNKTIEDILEHKRGKTQIIVGLDGDWPSEPIKDHPDVVVLHYSESIGQRAITKQCARLSKAKYIAKTDAHCAFDEGFDIKMLEAFKKVGDNIVMCPVMRNLHVFDWVCPDGHRRYQGESGVCTECGKETTKDVVWIAKTNPQSWSYCFDPEPHFQYFQEYKKRAIKEDNLTESMSLQGSFFMMTREKYFALDIDDENLGSWGSQGLTVACKFWLSGGRVLINHSTWYAHCFRTKGGDFGFPYDNPMREVKNNRKYVKELFFENKWEGQIKPLSWLLEKFWPVPEWKDEDLIRIKKFDSMVTVTHIPEIQSPLLGSEIGPTVSAPFPVASSTDTVADNTGSRERMSPLAKSFTSINCSKTIATEDIFGMEDKSHMSGITTPNIVTNVVNDGDILSDTSSAMTRDRSNQPGIHKTMNGVIDSIDSNCSISPFIGSTNPIPTSSNIINTNLGEQSFNIDGTDIGDSKKIIHIPTKSILYYTDCQLNIKLAKKCREYVKASGLPITSVSLKPMPWFGNNIYFEGERGVLTMFRQILAGLEAMKEDVVFFAEADCLYPKEHFDFIPTKEDVFYYNSNVWRTRLNDDFSVYFDHQSVSGLCAYRELLIKEYKERVHRVELEGFRHNGYEPGTRSIRRGGFSDYKYERWQSKIPYVDIRHGNNLTESRWSQDKFRNKSTCQNWKETYEVPGWGKISNIIKL